MKMTFAPLVVLLTATLAALDAATPPPVRVLLWDEQQPQQKQAYGDEFLGETIAAHLATQPGFTVKNPALDIRPGHETYPVFKQVEPLRVVENAPRWLAQSTRARNSDQAALPAARFDPVLRDIEGWKVHVEPALIDGAHREEGEKALAMLANHLQRIKILVPAEPLARLQTIEIWIEHDHPRMNSMQYHPSRGWLVTHGHDPRLARKVHITQARELLSRGQMLKHPAVVLHELAHGYHDQFLDFDQPEILAAYEKAKASGSYTNVLLYTGQRVKHYGLTDQKEYFAEGTEAYFYRNDFYPFVRAELKEHDPTLHEALLNVWGPAD